MKDITDTVNDVCNVLHDAVTVAMLPNGLQLRPIQTVPACPVQIRAHHHTGVCTGINKVQMYEPYFLVSIQTLP